MSQFPAFYETAHVAMTVAKVDVPAGAPGELKEKIAQQSEALVQAFLEQRAVSLPNGQEHKASELFSTRIQYDGDALSVQMSARTHAWRGLLSEQKTEMRKNALGLLPTDTTLVQKFSMLASLMAAKVILSKDDLKNVRDSLFDEQEAYVIHKNLLATTQAWIDQNGVEKVILNARKLCTEAAQVINAKARQAKTAGM